MNLEHTPLDTAAFLQRLQMCVDAVGGKRMLAEAAGMSEPQLYRYLRGDGEPSASKLTAIAKAAKVDVGWLLTGEGRPEPAFRQKPTYDSGIYLETRRLVDEAWTRIERFVSDDMQLMITDLILYERLHQSYIDGASYALNLNNTIYQILFLLAFDADNLTIYRKFVEDNLKLSGLHPKIWTVDRLLPLCNAINRAHVTLFNGAYGITYYDRMGQTVWPQAGTRLQKLVDDIYKLTPKKQYRWLDVGCGNGREISFLHRNFEHIDVHGIETSPYCLELCQQQVATENLPVNCVTKEDVRYYKSDVLFDVIYSRLTLDKFPYVSYSHELGLLQVLKQLKKSLAPNGVVYQIMRQGQGCEHAVFQQLCTPELAAEIARTAGFELIKYEDVGLGKVKLNDENRYDKCCGILMKRI